MAEQKYIRTEYADGSVVLSNLRCKNTDELYTATKVTVYADGTPMTDDDCDGTIYRKLGGEYFKRNFTGAVNVKWFGAKDDGSTNTITAIRNIQAAFPDAEIVLKFTNTATGVYYFDEQTSDDVNIPYWERVQNIMGIDKICKIIIDADPGVTFSWRFDAYQYFPSTTQIINPVLNVCRELGTQMILGRDFDKPVFLPTSEFDKTKYTPLLPADLIAFKLPADRTDTINSRYA
jgi:hypothetical protein